MANSASARGYGIDRVVAPGAVLLQPIAPVGPRRRLVVAAHAEILPVANCAPFAIPLGHEPMAEVPPRIVVVPRCTRVVTRDAVVALVAGQAGLAALPCFVDAQACRRSVELDPTRPVRTGTRERDPSSVTRSRCGDRCGAEDQQTEQHRCQAFLRSHNATPVFLFGRARCPFRIHTRN